MAQQAELSIRTQILYQEKDEAEVVELSAPASVYEKDNSCFIMYDETDPDNGAKTACRIRLARDRIEITRKGQTCSRMELAEGKDTAADYRTPYGVLKLEIHTDILLIERTAEYLEIKAEYELSADGAPMSRNKMLLRADYRLF